MKRTPVVLTALVLLVASVVLAGILLAVDRTPRERVAALAVDAVVEGSGDVAIAETFTWDFDTATRSQILRTIPTLPAAGRDGVVPVRDVAAASATASAELTFEPQSGLEVVVIGDPKQSLTGAHDYRLTYTLGSVASGRAGDATVELNLIGTLSEVPIDNASVSLTVPGALLSDVVCSIGGVASTTRCAPTVVPAAGSTTITFGPVDLEPEQGISMLVAYDAPVDPAAPVQPFGADATTTVAATPPSLEGLATESTPPPPAGGGVLALLIGFPLVVVAGAGGAWLWVRRHGRDQRWAGSAVDAVFAGDGPTTTVGEAEAHDLVTVAFVPPRGVRPGEGGALWRLRSGTDDQVATVVDLAVRGWLTIDESDRSTTELVWRGAGDPSELAPFERTFLRGLFPTMDPETAAALHLAPPTASEASQSAGSSQPSGSGELPTDLPTAHLPPPPPLPPPLPPPPLNADRPRVVLGTYSASFATAWRRLGHDLDDVLANRHWLRNGAAVRTVAAIAAGTGLVIAGLAWAFAIAGGRVAGQTALGWAVVLPGAVLAGLGVGTLLAAGGMRARTPEGFSVWAQVEGLRLFMDGSEGEHARQAADNGMLRQYVAWAVALDEVDRWESACEQAGLDPTQGWMLGGVGLGMGLGRLRAGSSTAATQPKSSGAGGGFSGSVGGGAGGGGFGSR